MGSEMCIRDRFNIIEQVISKTHKLIKGVWGMPRLSETMKDVISCDKLWVVAHTL